MYDASGAAIAVPAPMLSSANSATAKALGMGPPQRHHDRPRAQVLGGGRVPDEVPLRVVAAEAREAVERGARLDALGSDTQAERARQLDGGAHDRVVGGVAVHHRDERAVDLDLVDWQALKLRERGVAGAEVVDRPAHADAREPVEH